MQSPIPLAAFAAALTAAGCGGAKATPEAAPAAISASTSPSDTVGLFRVRFARGTTSGLVNDSLRAGDTPDVALQAARATIRSRPKTSAPFYWANWMLVGQ